MSDPLDIVDAADEQHDELPTALAPIPLDAELLAEEQAEDDFDFDFDDDYAAEFADEWEPATSMPDLVVETDNAAGTCGFETPGDLE